MESRALDGAGGTIFGHAAVFDTLSLDLGGFREKIAPGAFAESIKNDDVVALFAHDQRKLPMGRLGAGTLRLEENSRGLAFEIDMPGTALAESYLEAIRRGDVYQASFSFFTLEDQWETEGGTAVRTLIKVRLTDVSPVTFAAYPATDVGVRTATAPRDRRSPEGTLGDELEALRLRQRLADLDDDPPWRHDRSAYELDLEALRLRQRLAEADVEVEALRLNILRR